MTVDTAHAAYVARFERFSQFQGWMIIDPTGRTVDALRTQSGAAYACRLLNSGVAVINPHAIIGNRVEVVN